MNTYFQYLSANELYKKYLTVFSLLEESEGELDEELEEQLKQIEDNLDVLVYDILNIIDNAENEKKLNKSRIDNLGKKNKSLDNQAEHLEKILQGLIKQQGKLTNKGSYNHKVGERSISVVKKTTNEVNSEFNDERFLKYNFNKVPADLSQRIKTFLQQKTGEEPVIERIVLKEQLNAAIKEGAIIENVEQKETTYLVKK